jgi:hypothetical protein
VRSDQFFEITVSYILIEYSTSGAVKFQQIHLPNKKNEEWDRSETNTPLNYQNTNHESTHTKIMSNAERGQTPCYFNSELIYTPLEENQRRLGFSSTQLFTRNGRSSTSLFTAEKTTDEKREAAEPQRQRQSGRTVTVVAETKKKRFASS